MDKDTVFLICMAFIATVSVIGNAIQQYFVSKYKNMADKLIEDMKQQYKDHEFLKEFSLQCIVKMSAEREDYEMASKCQTLLLEMQKKKTA